MKARAVDPGVRALMDEAKTLPDCAARDAIWERAAAAAEALEDLDTAWNARCNILSSSSSHAAPRFENLFLCLAWCLAVSDREPERFPASSVLWQYKWVATDAPKYASVPRGVLERVIDDMDERFARAGWGRRAGLQKRLELYQLLGEYEKALSLVRPWRSTPRDRGSDCSACEASSLADLLADLGQDGQALSEAAPIIAGRLSCATVPHSTFGSLLLPLVRLGRVEKAAELYDRGRRLVASMETGAVLQISPYLVFAAWSGRTDHAIGILRARLPEAVSVRSDHSRMRWFGHAAAALEFMAQRGVGALDLPAIPAALGAPEQTAAGLAESCRAIAAGHARALDARNGNGRSVEWLESLAGRWGAMPAV